MKSILPEPCFGFGRVFLGSRRTHPRLGVKYFQKYLNANVNTFSSFQMQILSFFSNANTFQKYFKNFFNVSIHEYIKFENYNAH